MRTIKIEIGMFGEPGFYATLTPAKAAMLMLVNRLPKGMGDMIYVLKTEVFV